MGMFEQALNERYAKYIESEIEIVSGKGSSNMASIGAATFILERFLASGGELGRTLELVENGMGE